MTVVLTRAQRRVLASTAAAMDKTTQEDQAFFLDNPGRSHRARLSSSAEITRREAISSKSSGAYGSHCWLFTLVRQLTPGVRMRVHVLGSAEMAGRDIGEAAARDLWHIAGERNPSVRGLEAELLAKLRSPNAPSKEGDGR